MYAISLHIATIIRIVSVMINAFLKTVDFILIIFVAIVVFTVLVERFFPVETPVTGALFVVGNTFSVVREVEVKEVVEEVVEVLFVDIDEVVLVLSDVGRVLNVDKDGETVDLLVREVEVKEVVEEVVEVLFVDIGLIVVLASFAMPFDLKSSPRCEVLSRITQRRPILGLITK